MRRWTAPWFALLLCVGVVLTGCTAGPSMRPAVIAVDGGGSGGGGGDTTTPPAKQAQPLPPLTKPHSTSIVWNDCGARTRDRLEEKPPSSLSLRCGDVYSVAKPQGHPMPVATHISLLKAGSGPIPLVVVNDIGGTPGTLYAAMLAGKLPKNVLEKFSLIGVDRRGTGASHGLHCVPRQVRGHIVGYDPDSTDLSGLLDAESKATQQCLLNLDNTRQAFTTWQTSADLEHIRDALGVPRLNAIGHGEGGRVVATYATRFPGKSGRIVLDGTPDPSTDAEQRARTRAAAAEHVFDAFARHCGRHDCPLGAHPREAVTKLLDKLRAQPLLAHTGDSPAERDEQSVEVTGGTAMHAMLQALPHPRRWPSLAQALADAAGGDGSGLAELVRPLLTGSSQDAALLDARLVTECNDESQRLPPQKITAASKSWRSENPLFGGYFAQGLSLCSPWPVPSHHHPDPTAGEAPPILVLSTAHDPITPAVGTEHAAARMDTSVLVKWQGSGHGALTGSSCAAQAATKFLTAGDTPTNGTVCPP